MTSWLSGDAHFRDTGCKTAYNSRPCRYKNMYASSDYSIITWNVFTSEEN